MAAILSEIPVATLLQPLSREEQPSLEVLLKDVPKAIGDVQLSTWDAGLFNQELVKLKIAPVITNLTNPNVPTQSEENDGDIEKGTWAGTQLAITDLYHRIENGWGVLFAATGIDGVLPLVISDRAHLFQWSDGTDGYPPHLDVPRGGEIPKPYNASKFEIFNTLGLLNTAGMLIKITPKTFLGRISQKIYKAVEDFLNGKGYEGLSIADLEAHNKEWRKTAVDIMKGANFGDLPDWYSDARFAQQSFTGANPNTIRLATDQWLSRFKQAATTQKLSDVLDVLEKTKAGSFYMQDCSYFRDAIKPPKGPLQPKAELKAEDRYGMASVTLYRLAESGRLHPVAIVLDWRGSVQDSVTIFNKQLTPLDPQSSDYNTRLEEQKHDWPWRYAKTCAQSCDWIRHELTVHLTNTHMIEEAIIVAANRSFKVEHPVFKLLEPHWYRTLPLNAAARSVLVPSIIFDLVGFSHDQSYQFIKHGYAEFDFQANYVPQDLASRGFLETELTSDKFKNYPYAQNALSMWKTIRKFVHSMIAVAGLDKDEAVAADAQIRTWSSEVRNKGQIPTFPDIKTSAQLIDAITMSIHLAAPQHSTINYLQNFYMGFVPAKPPCLYSPLPKTREELGRIHEPDLLHALPVGHQREWLLTTQIPWLLSYKVAEEANLFTYSESLYNLLRKEDGAKSVKVKEIAATFRSDLRDLISQFQKSSDKMTPDTVPYVVMNPRNQAVSILI